MLWNAIKRANVTDYIFRESQYPGLSSNILAIFST